MAKLVYIYLLGYPVEIGHMEAVALLTCVYLSARGGTIIFALSRAD